MHTISSPPNPLEARLFLVDDYEIIRHGLATSLQVFFEDNPHLKTIIRIVGTANNGAEALAQIPNADANVVFIDVMMPDMSGLVLIRRLREMGFSKERLRILVVTELTTPNIREIFASGANGYISKQEPTEVFAEALTAILKEPINSWLKPEVARELVKTEYALKTYELTPAEIETLQLLHLSNAEIAEYLGITAGTVRNHLANIYAKLNVSTRKEVEQFAKRLGLVSMRY
ncbi:MAG: response regulator [Candidatus Kapaibacteriota bacterium]|jgi:DNA-binding NarL/FixJ family response regulator